MAFHFLYHRLSSDLLVQGVERFFIFVAIIAFLFHILLIYLAYNVPYFYSYQHIVAPSYLSSLSTPFTVILYFEIFLLLLSIPKSLLLSVAIQYEIVSLILLRKVFTDISQVEVTFDSFFSVAVLGQIIADMAGALVVFFLVALFTRLSKPLLDAPLFKSAPVFVLIKQSFAVLLALILVISLVPLVSQSIFLLISPLSFASFASFDFYKDFFTFLIFVDILLLLISLFYTDDYGLVFLYAGFIVSTILIRLSFVAGGFLETGLSVFAVLFGVALLFVYRRMYHDLTV